MVRISVENSLSEESLRENYLLVPKETFDHWDINFFHWKFSGFNNRERIYVWLKDSKGIVGRIVLYELKVEGQSEYEGKHFLLGDFFVDKEVVNPLDTFQILNTLRGESFRDALFVFPNAKSYSFYTDFMKFKAFPKNKLYFRFISPNEFLRNLKYFAYYLKEQGESRDKPICLRRVPGISHFRVDEYWIKHKYSEVSGRHYYVGNAKEGDRGFRVIKFLKMKFKIHVDTLVDSSDLMRRGFLPIFYFSINKPKLVDRFPQLAKFHSLPNYVLDHPMTMLSNVELGPDLNFVLGDIDSF